MQGESSSPPSRFGARHFVGGLLLLTVLGVLSREWVLRRHEPRYLGLTEREWFPLWPQGSLPAAQLTVAPPEALPMLLAALHRSDSRLVDSWNVMAERGEGFFKVDMRALAPFEVRALAIDAMIQSASLPGFAAALTERFESLSMDDQRGLLLELGRSATPSASVRQLSPLLLKFLAAGEGDLAWYSGLALMKDPDLARGHLAQLIPFVGREMMRTPVARPGVTLFLSRLGDLEAVGSVDLQPLAEAVQATAVQSESGKHIRNVGSFTLSRLDPGQFPPHRYLEGTRNGAERNGRVVYLGTMLEADLRGPHLPGDLEAWLEVFLRIDDYDRLAPSSSERLAYRDRALSILQELPRRAPLSPQIQSAILAGMDNGLPAVRRATAAALVQIKKPAPTVIERAAALLAEGFEPDFMLQVLEHGRVIPESVRGLVRDLAAGVPPVDWTPKPTLSDASARRLSLPTVRNALPALAKGLLWKVEETGGSGTQK
jgi:hypothetical protein